jgi:hypothetical protein
MSGAGMSGAGMSGPGMSGRGSERAAAVPVGVSMATLAATWIFPG